MQINQKLVPTGWSNNPNRRLENVHYITIHTTGNRSPGATARAHARYQYNGSGGRMASWHYTVDESEIWQSFEDDRMCWHTGTTRGNETSLGIEICVNSERGFLRACENAAWLTAKLLREFSLGLDKVVQHHFWSGKNCPRELRTGEWNITWQNFLDMVKNRLGDDEMIYQTVKDMPNWAQGPIKALLQAELLSGVDDNPNLNERRLDMPETMMRTLVVTRNMVLNQDRLK